MIRLVLSILGPFLFIANYWVCEYIYPGSAESWDIFIPMDKICHNFWAVIIMVYAISCTLPITKPITYYFIYLGVCFSGFDIMARYFGMAEFHPKWYVLSLLTSFILSGILYATKRKSID